MTETIEQFLKRGGKIKKVDFSKAYKNVKPRKIDWSKYKKKTDIERQIDHDKNSSRP